MPAPDGARPVHDGAAAVPPLALDKQGIDEWFLDPPGIVNTDLPCDGCGYNLRTLHALTACPECGTPVRDTLRTDELCYAPIAWVRSLATGAWILSAGFGALALVFGRLSLITLLSRDTLQPGWNGAWRETDGTFAFLAAPLLLLVGGWLLTCRDPRHRALRKQVWARPFARGLLLLIPAAPVCAAGGTVTRTLGGPWLWVAFVCGLLANISGAATLLLLLPMLHYHVRKLAQRLPAGAGLASYASIVTAFHFPVLFFAVCAGVFPYGNPVSCLIALAGVIATTVLYVRLARALREVVTQRAGCQDGEQRHEGDAIPQAADVDHVDEREVDDRESREN